MKCRCRGFKPEVSANLDDLQGLPAAGTKIASSVPAYQPALPHTPTRRCVLYPTSSTLSNRSTFRPFDVDDFARNARTSQSGGSIALSQWTLQGAQSLASEAIRPAYKIRTAAMDIREACHQALHDAIHFGRSDRQCQSHIPPRRRSHWHRRL